MFVAHQPWGPYDYEATPGQLYDAVGYAPRIEGVHQLSAPVCVWRHEAFKPGGQFHGLGPVSWSGG
ncbi:hypothetical protein MASR2M48_20530 [Spirochaetota bacterium]